MVEIATGFILFEKYVFWKFNLHFFQTEKNKLSLMAYDQSNQRKNKKPKINPISEETKLLNPSRPSNIER